MAAGEKKVSLMDNIASAPGTAKMYIVLADGSYGYITKEQFLDGVVGGSQDIDETLGNGSVTDKSITLKNTVNDKRKIVINPNTVNGPELQIWEDVEGVSTLLGSLTSYAFSMLYQALGGANLTWDPFVGLSIDDGTQSLILSQYGLTVNAELYEWPTTAGGGKLASEQFVNALLEGIKSKDPVRVATTANITLSGTQTIDGVAVSVGDRVLVKNQTTQSQNGIYVVAGGAWARSIDANTATELTNALVPVTEGTVNANTTYRQQTTSIVLGTSNIVFQTYGTLVPDADSSTKGKMKLYTAMGTATDGTITQALFKSEIDTLTSSVGNKKDADVILSVGGSATAQVGRHYVVASNTQTITDPSSPINGSQFTMFVISCTLTLGGVAASYTKTHITRYYNGSAWVNVVVDIDSKQTKPDYIKLTSAYTLASSTSLQKLFNVGSGSAGAYDAGANRTIRFECEFDLTGLSSSSGDFKFGVLGTAGIASINYKAISFKANTLDALNSGTFVSAQVATAVPLSNSGTQTTAKALIHGTIVTSTAGTIILAVATSVATASCQVGVNSFAQFEDIGADTLTATSNIS